MIKRHSRRVGKRLVLLALLAGAWQIGRLRPNATAGDKGRPATAASRKSAPKKPGTHRGPACLAVDPFFVDEVWAKVGERTCLKCHNPKGDAAESKFLLQDPAQGRGAHGRNRAVFARMAKIVKGGKSKLLLKAAGRLDHGGGEVLKADSSGYRILAKFVRRLKSPGKKPLAGPPVDPNAPPFFDGIKMMPPERLLRRVTLSLAGRLPSEKERSAVRKGGLKAMDGILDAVMRKQAFYERLKEGFNDVFLTTGYKDLGLSVLSYDHFRTRLWYQKYDLGKGSKKQIQRKRWALARTYNESIRRESLELIEYIVREDRPFTEVVTADYIMVSPYSSRGYGVFDQVRHKFKNPDDPFEYVPVRLKALKSRNGKVQESATGYYPHAGLLSMFHYLRRYPTTDTNRNRLRARMYYRHFLGIDVMALAPRVTDAAAVTAKFKVPTMEAADCVVCHKTIDPVAGLFQDFNDDGHLGPRKGGWYTDMFPPGFEGEDLPKSERWRALQWLGERTAKDPRFATAMVEHVYYILMGRKVLQPPQDIDDPLFAARRRAYREQRRLIDRVAKRFVAAKFDLKVVFKALVVSDFYRADGLATIASDPKRQAEIDDVGLVHLLTPEQLERKIAAVFGRKWGRLMNRESKLNILYGGIDAQSVTKRMTDPSGAMGAIQRIMSNDVACKNVALDFTRNPEDRLLFPDIEPDVVPGTGKQADAKIRRAIVYLHRHLLGRSQTVDHPEVDRTFQLFAGIVADAKQTKGIDKRGSYSCDRVDGKRLDDPDYTIRAWRGVVTYLLRQHDFLYE